ncbi:MAG: DUF1854 domain-containing protein [Chloroflexi bacterium]|nr:DUF1854 domain-containing protein [Chloroflexota bacterium]
MEDHILAPESDLDPHTDPRLLHFSRGRWGLRLTVDGDRSLWRVRIRFADPLRYPDEFISVLTDPDREVLMLNDLTVLDEESQRVINESLGRFYAVPAITRVRSLSYKLGPLYWHVDTTHGEREFVLHWSSENVVDLPGGRVRLMDVSGNRYDLPDLGTLDEDSRKLIMEALT